MTDLETLRLRFEDGRYLETYIRRRTSERSPHTGRDLTELHCWATTADARIHEELAVVLRSVGDRAITAFDESGEFAGKWSVSWNSYGESAGVHTYTLVLREAEELTLEALVVEDLEVHPYEYREEIVDDGLIIWAKVVGSEGDVQRVRETLRARSSLVVLRRGISDRPRLMRLGAAQWSEWEDRIKYRLVLVDQELSGGVRSTLARIDEENSAAAIGFYANFLDRLTETLIAKGVLAAEEVQELRDAARAQTGVVRHDFWHVVDIDDL